MSPDDCDLAKASHQYNVILFPPTHVSENELPKRRTGAPAASRAVATIADDRHRVDDDLNPETKGVSKYEDDEYSRNANGLTDHKGNRKAKNEKKTPGR